MLYHIKVIYILYSLTINFLGIIQITLFDKILLKYSYSLFSKNNRNHQELYMN